MRYASGLGRSLQVCLHSYVSAIVQKPLQGSGQRLSIILLYHRPRLHSIAAMLLDVALP